MAKERKELKLCTFKVSPEDFERIENLAIKRGTSKSELMRSTVLNLLKEELSADNIGLVRSIIHEELESVLFPYMERMIALQVKSVIHSATSGYLNAEAISRWVPDEMQDDMKTVYDKARKKAILSVKTKESELDSLD